MTKVIDNRENVEPIVKNPVHYIMTEQEFMQMAANIQQLVELTNSLNNALSAEGKMVRGFLTQITQNFMAVKPQKKEGE
jgi:hypothetical protein